MTRAGSVDRSGRRWLEAMGSAKTWWHQKEITGADIARTIAGGHAEFIVAHDAPQGVPTIEAKLRGNLGGFPQNDLQYAYWVRTNFTAAFEAVEPLLLLHGHYHFPVDEPVDFDGFTTHVFGLSCDGDPDSLGCWTWTPCRPYSSLRHHRRAEAMPARRATRILMRLRQRAASRVETAAIIRDPELVRAIREGDAAIARGDVFSLDDAQARLAARSRGRGEWTILQAAPGCPRVRNLRPGLGARSRTQARGSGRARGTAAAAAGGTFETPRHRALRRRRLRDRPR